MTSRSLTILSMLAGTALIVLPATLIPLAGLTLALLPRIKGAFIGLMYVLGVREADARMHTADAAE